ncbi:MAG TPA: 2-dehydropantoate 2-reductase [Candidatus Angelobacter sp.]|nr:2-dehydropantoate 2-reductase [Candidatus Angelobacter sp.]
MKHAVLGVGGVGGLIAGALAHLGESVTLVVRPDALPDTPADLSVESSLGSFSVAVDRVGSLRTDCDVLWIAVKATQLDGALKQVSTDARIGAIVPLLNGIDHVELLRSRFGGSQFSHDRVVPATISVESERVAPGRIVHRSPFVRLRIAAAGKPLLEAPVAKLRQFGFDCEFIEKEADLLWSKLVFIAPLALATTASNRTAGEVAADPEWRGRLEACAREACAVAVASGAQVDAVRVTTMLLALPPGMRSSMQKDVAAEKPPELDAIAGPILRGGRKLGIDVSTTHQLVETIEKKVSAHAR